jgi:Transposase IS116/IS110/IS902 family
MSPHEQGDIRREPERVTTSGDNCCLPKGEVACARSVLYAGSVCLPMTEEPEAAVLTARRATQHVRLSSHDAVAASAKLLESSDRLLAGSLGRDPELQRFYRRKLVQKGLGKAIVAVARKLGIRTTTRPLSVEPSRPTRDRVVVVETTYCLSAERVTVAVREVLTLWRPVTVLATEVFLGDPARFADSKALASYVGMIPREYSSGERQRWLLCAL